MPDSEDQPQRPAQFAAALNAIRSSSPRPELVVTEISAPGNLAPYAVALSADVTPVRHGSDSDFGTGRFILLYDPDEPESWGGPFRVVCFAQAPLENDIGVDPFLAEVAWAWLVDALDTRGANYTAASGTATKILSSGFGELAAQGDGAQIELRASWSPLDNDLAAHVEGWGELLCMLAGLPPASELPAPPRHGHPSSSRSASSSSSSARHGRPPGAEGHGSSEPGPDLGTSGPGSTAPGSTALGSTGQGSSGITLGPVDQIGPSASSVLRTGPGLHTLGVAAGGRESAGRETAGGDFAGLDAPGAERAGRETAGMNVMAGNAVVTETGPGMNPGALSNTASGMSNTRLTSTAPNLTSVAYLSAHRASRG
ncbi:hypothetical protein RCH12_000268 [Cryobacterium sp. MP_3.1]|nr:hypothetical protein [Cryobacterium sp. MP_3.1]